MLFKQNSFGLYFSCCSRRSVYGLKIQPAKDRKGMHGIGKQVCKKDDRKNEWRRVTLTNTGLWLEKQIQLKQNFSLWFLRPDI